MKRTSVWYYIHITARERADGARSLARPFSAACSLCRIGWMDGSWWVGERRAARGTLDLTPNLPVWLCPDCILIAASFLLCLPGERMIFAGTLKCACLMPPTRRAFLAYLCKVAVDFTCRLIVRSGSLRRA
jgi:hypothetical protein